MKRQTSLWWLKLDFSNHFVHKNSAPFSQQARIQQSASNQSTTKPPPYFFFSSDNPFHLDVACSHRIQIILFNCILNYFINIFQNGINSNEHFSFIRKPTPQPISLVNSIKSTDKKNSDFKKKIDIHHLYKVFDSVHFIVTERALSWFL